MQTEGEDIRAVLDDRIVGLPAIAEVVGVSLVTMRKMAVAGANCIPVRMVSGRWWASRRRLEQWVRDQLMTPAERSAEIEAIGAWMIRTAEEQAARHIEALRSGLVSPRGVALDFEPLAGTGAGRQAPEDG